MKSKWFFPVILNMKNHKFTLTIPYDSRQRALPALCNEYALLKLPLDIKLAYDNLKFYKQH